MKSGNYIVVLLLLFISSCELLTFQNTNDINLANLNQLIEIIDENGDSVSLDSVSELPPFLYRNTIQTEPVSNIQFDSLYYLQNQQGEIIDKWQIKELIKYNKRKNRYEHLLSNGKYIYFEIDKNAIFTVSIQVDNASELKNELMRGRYKNIAEKPDNW